MTNSLCSWVPPLPSPPRDQVPGGIRTAAGQHVIKGGSFLCAPNYGCTTARVRASRKTTAWALATWAFALC